MGLVERAVRTIKELLRKNPNLSQLQLAELAYAVKYRTQGDHGSAMSRFLGRGTRGNLPNNWDRQMDCKKQVQLRGEQRQKRLNKIERTLGRKETYEIGERVKLQNIKTKLWDLDGVVTGIGMLRMAQ